MQIEGNYSLIANEIHGHDIIKKNICNNNSKKYRKRDDQMIKADFNDYKLFSELLKAISMLNFKEFTKVQKQVIPIALEEKELKQKTHIVVGTPGRIVDHIENCK